MNGGEEEVEHEDALMEIFRSACWSRLGAVKKRFDEEGNLYDRYLSEQYDGCKESKVRY